MTGRNKIDSAHSHAITWFQRVSVYSATFVVTSDIQSIQASVRCFMSYELTSPINSDSLVNRSLLRGFSCTFVFMSRNI